jgi:hypothetical protein
MCFYQLRVSCHAQQIGDRGKLTSLLQKEWSASRDSERKLDLGLLLTDVLINQVHFYDPVLTQFKQSNPDSLLKLSCLNSNFQAL